MPFLQRCTNRNWFWFFPLLLAAVPAWMAWQFTCGVPHADHWMMAGQPYFDWQDGARSFWSAVYSQGNDSRYVVSTLAEFFLIAFTKWNLRIESLLCVLLALGTATCVIGLFRGLHRRGIAYSWFMAVLACAMILSPQQWMNWTFGVQICYAAVVLATVAVVLVFETAWPLVLRSVAGALCATIAAHSFINGWLAWLLGLLYLVREAWSGCHGRRQSVIAFTIWLGLFVVTAAFYFSGYAEGTQAPGTSLLSHVLTDPGALVRFFLSVLGAPFADGWAAWDRELRIHLTHAIGPVVGVISLILFAVALLTFVRRDWARHDRMIFPFLLLSLWGLANAAAIALGRTGMVISDPFQSRYPAYIIWFHIGLMGILAGANGRIWQWVRACWLVFIAYAHIIGFIQGLRAGERDFHQNRIMTAAIMMRHVAPDPVNLDWVMPGQGRLLLQSFDRLESMGCLHVLTLRSERVQDAPFNKLLALGELKNGRLETHGVLLEGWAMELPSRRNADAIAISCQPEGGEETWLGLAQRRIIKSKLQDKLHARAFEQRLGWQYETPAGDQKSIYSEQENPFHSKPLPSGKVTFRAYACDLDSGNFTQMEGAFTTQLP